ncbi:MAG: hypothetical protein JSW26_08595 [Desulfobacterales bacterium]|nr:MAG: hypothetical protein JSW26_08595 [Desulfobacterales bacterium]
MRELKSVLGANFEAVDVSSLMLDSDSGQCMPQNQGPDYDGDGDIDGSDLGEYAKRIQLGTATLTMELFALNFGRSANPSYIVVLFRNFLTMTTTLYSHRENFLTKRFVLPGNGMLHPISF